ncbi:MAG TPA: sugar ABC transporter permease, partial [Clostridia bacterium]|nr:sugar ABC transporter permease [Clostridia bacterium]
MSRWVDRHLKIIFILPCLLFILFMVLFPLGYNIFMSTSKWSMSALSSPTFVGFDNYLFLFRSQRFWLAVGRTIYYAFVGVFFQALLGIAVAQMLNRAFLGKGLAKTLFLLPVVATPVAVGMVWQLIYEPTIGLGNAILTGMGFKPQLFLGSTATALNALILIDVWEWTPMVMLMVLAGMLAIPRDPYESAVVDGATAFQRFRYITLPLASPTILVAVLLRLIDAIKTFDIIYATTKGGPGFATETINIYATLATFQYYSFGEGAAITMCFF